MNDSRHRQIAASLGASIARKRATRQLTQEQVAEHIGVGNEAISRIERGVVLPPLIRLYEMAELFGCRVDELLLEASDRASDTAAAIAVHMSQLSPTDRELVLNLVVQLSERLARPTKSR